MDGQGGRGRVVVVGSANEDQTYRVQSIPVAGQTIVARSVTTTPGGKGANQAVAAARGGASTVFVGAFGSDERGQRLRAALQSEGVRVHDVPEEPEPTGTALVLVDDAGANAIVVLSGANACLSGERVAEGLRDLKRSDVVLVQCEISVEAIARALTLAEGAGATSVLNLAPFSASCVALISLASLLVVNEVEARAVLDYFGLPQPDSVEDLASRVWEATVTPTIITLGSQGSGFSTGDGTVFIPAVPAEAVVDTTGAGDAYAGVLAGRLTCGDTVAEAMVWATLAGSISVSRIGAQSSYAAPQELAAARRALLDTNQLKKHGHSTTLKEEEM